MTLPPPASSHDHLADGLGDPDDDLVAVYRAVAATEAIKATSVDGPSVSAEPSVVEFEEGSDLESAGDRDAAEPTVPAEVETAAAAQRRPRDVGRYRALADVLVIGDPGRQEEVVPVHGPLSVGVADTELDFSTVDPFEVRACSTRGASHRHVGTPRQDAFCVASNERHLVVCVADGVSQGTYSQVAAETAARAACKLVLDLALAQADWDWTAVANRISRRILDEAKYRRLVDLTEVDDPAEQIRVVRAAMSTTAVVAVIDRRPNATGGFAFVIAVLAGDSGAYLLSDDTWALVAGGKDIASSVVADGAVHPLPGPSAPVVLRSSLSAKQMLLVTTDGVGDPLGDGSGPVGRALAERWSTPPTAAQFFSDVNFVRRSFDDDRTAVGVWVLPEQDAAALAD